MKKIAILRRNGLGDLLCTYPLILYLQNQIPPSEITLFVDARNAPLIPYLPPVDRVVVFPEKGNKYWNLFRKARAYRNQFDVAFSAKTSPMKLNNCFLYWLGAEKRIAYTDASWHSRLINAPIVYEPTQSKQTHQALKCLRMVAPDLLEVPSQYYPQISLPKSDLQLDLPPFPRILLTATTTKEASRVDPKRYAGLLNRLYLQTPFSVVVVGQEKDAARTHEIASLLKMPNQVHFPRNFEMFMILLDTCDLFFVGDGGVAHIGAALGKKLVVLYGETNPLEWRPLSIGGEVFYHPQHVNHLDDHEIFQGLVRQIDEVMKSGRENL